MTYVNNSHYVYFALAAIIITTLMQSAEMHRAEIVVKQVVQKCRTETGATDADFDSLVRKEIAPSMPAKCLRACLMKHFNMMDENGKFNKDFALKITQERVADDPKRLNAATDIINICHTMEVSDNHCEAAEQYRNCANDHISGRGLSDQMFG